MSKNPYFDFVHGRSLEPASLGGVQFHINPSNFDYATSFVHYEQVTLAGVGTNRYGANAPIINIDGFTGIQGVDGIQRLKQFRALPGVQPKLLSFKYPNRFGDRILYVYVNTISDSISDQMHLYNNYKIELVEFPRDTQPTVKQLASTIGSDIASIITAGPAPLPASPSGTVSTTPANPIYNVRNGGRSSGGVRIRQ